MKDKRILNGQMAYMFKECDDGIEMFDGQGFITSADDIVELCHGLIKYALTYKDNIDIYNEKHKYDVENEINEWKISCELQEKSYRERKIREKKKGYVYLLECGGKFKVGFSNNVERRMRQLDTRPFKLNLVVKSEFLSDAYDREQELHEDFEGSRIEGEWYDFTKEELAYVIEVIKGMKEENYEQ